MVFNPANPEIMSESKKCKDHTPEYKADIAYEKRIS